MLPSSSPLPQRFDWVRTRAEGHQAIEILDREIAQRPAPPSDIRRLEVETIALAATRRALLRDADELRLVTFDGVELPGRTGKRCSGFQIYDLDALEQGQGRNATVVTVMYMHELGDRNEFALAIVHENQKSAGDAIVQEIEHWNLATTGKTAHERLAARNLPPPAPIPSVKSSSGSSPRSSYQNSSSPLSDAVDSAIDGWIIADALGAFADLLGCLLDGFDF